MATFNIMVPKANFEFVVDESKMPANSCLHAHEYGWRQSLVDATASINRKDFQSDAEFNAAALVKAQARFDAYVSGTIGSRSAVDVEAVLAARYGLTVDQLRAAATAALDKTAKRKAA